MTKIDFKTGLLEDSMGRVFDKIALVKSLGIHECPWDKTKLMQFYDNGTWEFGKWQAE